MERTVFQEQSYITEEYIYGKIVINQRDNFSNARYLYEKQQCILFCRTILKEDQ